MVKTRKAIKVGKASPRTPEKISMKMGGDLDMFEDNFDMDSDDNVPQKTPKTPKGKQSLNDKRVSFQVPGKNTPGKTPAKNNNSMVKKQNTPGKGGLQAFKGMNQNNKFNNKNSKQDDDDDDDEDDDDYEDDDDLADLDLDLDDDEDDDDDADEDDDDDDDEEDEEEEIVQKKVQKNSQQKQKTPQKNANSAVNKNEEEDSDDDDEDEEEETVKSKIQRNSQQKQKTPLKNAKSAVNKNEEEDSDDDDEDDDDDDDDDEEENVKAKNNVQLKQKTPNKTAALTPKSEKKQIQNSVQTNSVKKENTTPKNVRLAPNDEAERRRQRDAKQLFVGNIPTDTTVEELKALSKDILNVVMPIKPRNKNAFAFLQFESEEVAEENFEILKNKKFRGQPLKVDYAGEKSLLRKKEPDNFSYNMKKLYVSNLPIDATIHQVAKFFPKCYQISFNLSSVFRTATVCFSTEEDANKAYNLGKDIELSGQKLSVLHSLSSKGLIKRKRPLKKSKGPNQDQPAKKRKIAKSEESD